MKKLKSRQRKKKEVDRQVYSLKHEGSIPYGIYFCDCPTSSWTTPVIKYLTKGSSFQEQVILTVRVFRFIFNDVFWSNTL